MATDPELKPLLDRFVRVRLVQMAGVDLEIYQFDPLLSWSIFFLNGDKTIYGRFGTASPWAKRSQRDSNDNHTTAGLKAALTAALKLHEAYAADRDGVGKRLANKVGPKPPWRYADETPAAKKHHRVARVKKDLNTCMHCHEVARATIDSYFMTDRAVPDRLLWLHPNPEVVGISLSKNHCARIVSVAPDSAAARAGLKTGDDVVSFAGQPLVSVADFSWVLHVAPDEGGKLPISVRRGAETVDLTLTLAPLWRRKGDFGWRYRVAGYAAWLWGGVSLKDSPDGVRVADRSPGWFKKTNRDAWQALRRGDVIVEVDGKTGWTRSTYLAYLMREKEPGSTVKLKVTRKGQEESVEFTLPEKRPEVWGH